MTTNMDISVLTSWTNTMILSARVSVSLQSKANQFFQQLLHDEVSRTLSKYYSGFILSHVHQLKSIKVLNVSGSKKENFEQVIIESGVRSGHLIGRMHLLYSCEKCDFTQSRRIVFYGTHDPTDPC